jgi:hypothetical protein
VEWKTLLIPLAAGTPAIAAWLGAAAGRYTILTYGRPLGRPHLPAPFHTGGGSEAPVHPRPFLPMQSNSEAAPPPQACCLSIFNHQKAIVRITSVRKYAEVSPAFCLSKSIGNF